LVDDCDVFLRVEAGILQGLVQEYMGGRACSSGNLSTLEICDGLDSHIRMHPQLCCGPFHVVDQEGLTASTCRKVGNDSAGGKHVDAASDHGLEQFQTSGEFDEIDVQSLFPPGAHVLTEPDLAVHGGRVKITYPDGCLRPCRIHQHAAERAHGGSRADTLQYIATFLINTHDAPPCEFIAFDASVLPGRHIHA